MLYHKENPMRRAHLLAGALGAALGLAAALPPSAGADDPIADYKRVELSALRKDPTTFRHVDVKFTGLFHKLENLWAPFFTPFVREDYIVFSVWPEDAELWTRAGWLGDLPTCFIRKDEDGVKDLLALKAYTPVELSGTVLSDFHGLPWVSIARVRKLDGPRYTNDELRAKIKSAKPAAAMKPITTAAKPATTDEGQAPAPGTAEAPAPSTSAPAEGQAPGGVEGAAPATAPAEGPAPAQPAAPQGFFPKTYVDDMMAAKDREIQELKSQLEELDKQNAQLKAGAPPAPALSPAEGPAAAAAGGDAAKAQAETEELRKTVEQLRKEAAEREAAAKAGDQTAQDLNAKIAALTQQVDAKDQLLKAAEANQGKLNEELNASRTHAEALKTEVDQLKAGGDTQALKDNLAKAVAGQEEAQKKLEVVQASLAEERKAVDEQAAKIKELEAQKTQQDAQVAEARQALADAETARQKAGQERAALENKNQELLNRIAYLEDLLRKLFGTIGEAAQKLSEVEKEKLKNGGTAPPPPAPATPADTPKEAPKQPAPAQPTDPAADDARLLELIEQIEKEGK
jgi:hypothetical protein